MRSIREGHEVDARVLDVAPEPFHEDVVMLAASAVHADPDAMIFENTCEGITGPLCSGLKVSGTPWRCS